MDEAVRGVARTGGLIARRSRAWCSGGVVDCQGRSSVVSGREAHDEYVCLCTPLSVILDAMERTVHASWSQGLPQ